MRKTQTQTETEALFFITPGPHRVGVYIWCRQCLDNAPKNEKVPSGNNEDSSNTFSLPSWLWGIMGQK